MLVVEAMEVVRDANRVVRDGVRGAPISRLGGEHRELE